MCHNYSYILYIYWVPVTFIKVQALLFTIFGSNLGRKPCTLTLDIAHQFIYKLGVIDTYQRNGIVRGKKNKIILKEVLMTLLIN